MATCGLGSNVRQWQMVPRWPLARFVPPLYFSVQFKPCRYDGEKSTLIGKILDSHAGIRDSEI